MRLILIAAIASLTLSCASEKRCLRRYPPGTSVDTVFHEITRDSVIYRDTTIVITLPGQTILDSIFIRPGIIETSPVIMETDLARAEAYYRTPMVYLKLVQKDTTLLLRLDSAVRSSSYWKSQYFRIINNQVRREKYIPDIYKAALWGWIGAILLIILVLALRFFKPF